jgi:hypothetical protein
LLSPLSAVIGCWNELYKISTLATSEMVRDHLFGHLQGSRQTKPPRLANLS